MNKNAIKGRVLVILSTCLIWVMLGLYYLLYKMSCDSMCFYLYITGLLCGGTNLLFVILKVRYKQLFRVKFMQKLFFNKKILHKLRIVFCGLCFALYGVLLLYCARVVITFISSSDAVSSLSISNVVVFLLGFVILLILDKFCEHSLDNTLFVSAMLENCRLFIRLLLAENLIAAIVTVIEVLELFDIQRYVGYLLAILLLYCIACIFFSMLVIGIRKDFSRAPYLYVPLPIVQSSSKNISFVKYLEQNTGISMRSLWSIKFVRDIFPYAVVITAVLLWISTCFVQVETYQKAAVYRLGVLRNELLQPGFHLTLPYPFDKVEICDTETLNKMTIGYRTEVSADNIWTTNHQGEEYKLLMGTGDEVVSINLRIEYKISDLKSYLKNSSKPDAILGALSYELVTAQTIKTDLTTLLSADRDIFTDTFKKELSLRVKDRKLGLEVVSVILESIHPPKEIAAVYQETISAGIEAQQKLLQAEAEAVVKIMEAQQIYDEDLNIASGEYATKIAEAKSEVAEFMAGVEAYQSNKSAYTYQKYLNAVRQAYGNANLIIVSEDIDESALYFGDFSKEQNDSNEEKDTKE